MFMNSPFLAIIFSRSDLSWSRADTAESCTGILQLCQVCVIDNFLEPLLDCHPELDIIVPIVLGDDPIMDNIVLFPLGLICWALG